MKQKKELRSAVKGERSSPYIIKKNEIEIC